MPGSFKPEDIPVLIPIFPKLELLKFIFPTLIGGRFMDGALFKLEELPNNEEIFTGDGDKEDESKICNLLVLSFKAFSGVLSLSLAIFLMKLFISSMQYPLF
jgi:hypothetical protein